MEARVRVQSFDAATLGHSFSFKFEQYACLIITPVPVAGLDDMKHIVIIKSFKS